MLKGKTAVVTGAGRNVGEGIAEALAEYGASVVVSDIDEDRAADTVTSLPSDGTQTHSVEVADVTDTEAVKQLADAVKQNYDGLDVLVNNVGYAVNKDIFKVSLEEWNRVIALNLTSGFLCTKHLGPVIAASGGGSVINLASRLGTMGSTDKVAYCAAKGGVVNMTNQLALDLADYGIRVNAISPGNIGSPVSSSEKREGFDTSSIALDRIGEPRDIGNVVVFLASNLSDYITGANIPVDGGKQ